MYPIKVHLLDLASIFVLFSLSIWTNASYQNFSEMSSLPFYLSMPPCCNLIDHKGLPIIHIKIIQTYQRKETRTQMWNNRLYYMKRVHTKHRIEPSSHLAQQLIYMIYKQLQITTYWLGQLTLPYVANLISK